QFAMIGRTYFQFGRSKVMDRKSLSTNEGSGERQRRFAELVLALEPWFLKWSDAFPSHAVTAMQIGTYAEALDDLTPSQLELGCREATRTAEVFPKPGHIRKALEAVDDSGRDESYAGPRAVQYETVSQEERDSALEFSRKLREVLEAQDSAEKA